MSKTPASASHSTPSSPQGASQAPEDLGKEATQRTVSTVVFLNLTWQLAVVVLVPLIGGYELDMHYHTMPVWTLIGVGLTIVGVIGVLMRILKFTNAELSAPPKGKK